MGVGGEGKGDGMEGDEGDIGGERGGGGGGGRKKARIRMSRRVNNLGACSVMFVSMYRVSNIPCLTVI